MSKIARKSISVTLALTTALWLSGFWLSTPAQAVTIEDLMAQIATLQAQLVALQAAQTGQPAAFTYQWTRYLGQGDRGDDVSKLQQAVDVLGYYTYTGTPKYTGYYGAFTAAAVRRYQAANAISQTGTVGPITMASLNPRFATGVTPPTVTPPTVTPPTVTPPATGLAVGFAADNPGAVTVPKGSYNVAMLKVTFAGSGKVTGMTVKRVGAGLTADFANVYVYDGATRLTTGRSINTSTHEVSFSGLSVQVSATATKTLTISGDVATTAQQGDVNAFELASVTSDTTVTGTPLRGKDFTISGASSGTLTIRKTSSLSNPYLGTKGAPVSAFAIDAGSGEDIQVNRIALFYAGSTSRNNLQNFQLKSGGTLLASSSGVNDKDLVVFDFSTALAMDKGATKVFDVYADVVGNSKATETVKLYVDESSDVYATGKQYGFGVAVTKTAFDSDAADHHVLTLQGGQITLALNGPAAKDIARSGKDVEVLNFSLTSQINAEVRKFTLRVTTSSATTNFAANEYTDVKIVDTATGATVWGPKDLAAMTATSSQSLEYTDVVTLSSGTTKAYKVSMDVASTANADDAFTVIVRGTGGTTFGSSDIKNLDNNQFITTTDIVPTEQLAGNTMTVKAPTLTMSLAGTPVTQTFVKGSSAVPLVGINLKAGTASDVKVTTIKITGLIDSDNDGTFATTTESSVTVGTDVTSAKLYDGATQIGTTQSFSSSDGTATFSNLSLTITAGQTKTLVVKGDTSTTTGAPDRVAVTVLASDVTAQDLEGQTITLTDANLQGSTTPGVQITIADTGSVTVAKAADDIATGSNTNTVSEAGIITAGSSGVTLARFRFTAANEDLVLSKIRMSVPSGAIDSVNTIKLYDGSTLLGSAVPNSSGDADFSWSGPTYSGFTVAKDSSKDLTVKGDLNTIANGADSGDSVTVTMQGASGENFEFRGSGTSSTVITLHSGGDVAGNAKLVRKTVPTVTVDALPTTVLSGGTQTLLKFTVKNDGSDQLSFAKLTFSVTLSDNNTNTNLYIDTAKLFIAGGSEIPTTASQSNALTIADVANSASGQVAFQLTNEETVTAGGSKTYEFKATINNAATSDVITAKVDLQASSDQANSQTTFLRAVTSTSAITLLGLDGDGQANTVDDATTTFFIWSDNAAVPHDDVIATVNQNTTSSSADWINGFKIKVLPSDSKSMTFPS